MVSDPRILATLRRADVRDDTGLFSAYVEKRDAFIVELLGRYDLDDAGWKRRVVVRPGYQMAGGLASHLEAYNAGLGVTTRVIKRLAMASRGEARFVVTGQQPGALGGPLMAIHKAATAVALSRRLEAVTGVPCVPLYWVGSDDTDFSEIRETVLPGAKLHAITASIGTDDHDVGAPVGSISANAIRRLWNSVHPFMAVHDGGEFVSAVVESAIAKDVDHGNIAAHILSTLFGGEIALIDGRSTQVRESASTLVLDYFDREGEIKALIDARGQVLEENGYHAQLRSGADSGVFILEQGRRRTITDGSRSEVRRLIVDDISVASPGVILRSLIQDSVFAPVAVVLGPAEIAYRAQMQGVYESMGVASPVAFPRLFATFVPPAIAEVARSSGVPVDSLAGEARVFTKAVFDTDTDPEVKIAADRFRSLFGERAREFLETAGGRLPERERDRLGKRLEDISRRLDRVLDSTTAAGKSKALDRWPFLAGVEELFARKGVSQERYLSMLTPFLFGEEEATREAIALAAQAHVDAALDGRLLHVVYST